LKVYLYTYREAEKSIAFVLAMRAYAAIFHQYSASIPFSGFRRYNYGREFRSKTSVKRSPHSETGKPTLLRGFAAQQPYGIVAKVKANADKNFF
jgi:hypothetical protein